MHYMQCSQVKIQTPIQWKVIGCSSPSVIAQQYSSATFVQLRFYSRKDKQGMRLKILLHKFIYFC